MLDPLIASRAAHFASSLVVGGAAIFVALVARDVDAVRITVRRQEELMLAALVLAVASGATWLAFLAARIGQIPVGEAINDGTAWSVLTETQFGRVWEGRLIVALLLVSFALFGSGRRKLGRLFAASQAALAVLFVGMLAWSGHAAGTLGGTGILHLAADVLHLVAAAAWLGGLVPLLMFLATKGEGPEIPLLDRYMVLRQFSTLAAWSVTLIAASGIINTWFMTNGLQSFLGTDYGDLVLVKIGLFGVMLGFGAVNRYWLTPHLRPAAGNSEAESRALRLLCASVSIEIALGLVVMLVVAVLGQLPPPGHMHHAG